MNDSQLTQQIKSWIVGRKAERTWGQASLICLFLMMEATKAMLTELEVPPDQVKTEAFGAVKPAPAAAGTTAKPTAPASGPRVTFSTNSKSAKIQSGQTILELSEDLGIGIDFSCRVGTCGACKVQMTSGEVDQEVQDGTDTRGHDGSKGFADKRTAVSSFSVSGSLTRATHFGDLAIGQGDSNRGVGSGVCSHRHSEPQRQSSARSTNSARNALRST